MSQDEYNDYEFYPEPADEEARTPRTSRSGSHAKHASSGKSPASRRGPSGSTRSGEPSRRSSSSRPAPGRTPPRRKRRRRKRKSRAGKIVLIVIAVLVVALITAGVLIFSHFYGLMNTSGLPAPTPTPAAPEAAPTPGPEEETVTPTPEPTPTPTPEPLTEEEIAKQQELELMSSLQEDAEEIIYSDSVYNMLLIGVDDREEDGTVGRCDAMILVSINKETKTIWLTSILRDAQVTIPDWGKGHLNWTTNIGGIPLLLRTIENEANYALHIDNYALVNFVDFVKIADQLGPITVDLSLAEIEGVNKSVREVARILDVSRPYLPEEAGTYTLTNGLQILGYCRERHVGGNHARGVRQRDALIQMWNNARNMTLAEQYKLMELIMSQITTDLSQGKCASLLLSAPALINYEIKTQELPVEGAYWKGRDEQGLGIYNIDFRVNRNFIRATIYNEPMTAADLTSAWTGAKVLVMEPTA